MEGLRTRLDLRLGPAGSGSGSGIKVQEGMQTDGVAGDWQVVDLVAQWWRPNFEGFMVRLFSPLLTFGEEGELIRVAEQYPYVPA